MIRAIIYDCFGVLLTDSLESALNNYSVSEEDLKTIKDIVVKANWNYISPEESRRLISEILQITPKQWQENIMSGEFRNQQLFQDIKQLKESYKIAVLSNIGIGSFDKRFNKVEQQKYFDVVITSGEYGIAKPDKRIYQITADKLGIKPEECIFIDDRADFCDSAQVLGMKTIVYESYKEYKTKLNQLLSQS